MTSDIAKLSYQNNSLETDDWWKDGIYSDESSSCREHTIDDRKYEEDERWKLDLVADRAVEDVLIIIPHGGDNKDLLLKY